MTWAREGKPRNHTTRAQMSARWRFVDGFNVKFCSQVTFPESVSKYYVFRSFKSIFSLRDFRRGWHFWRSLLLVPCICFWPEGIIMIAFGHNLATKTRTWRCAMFCDFISFIYYLLIQGVIVAEIWDKHVCWFRSEHSVSYTHLTLPTKLEV